MTTEQLLPSITIRLRFHGPMRRYLHPSSSSDVVAIELELGRTLADAVRQAGLPVEAEWAAVVDDRIVGWHYVPRAEETITILPALAGG